MDTWPPLFDSRRLTRAVWLANMGLFTVHSWTEKSLLMYIVCVKSFRTHTFNHKFFIKQRNWTTFYTLHFPTFNNSMAAPLFSLKLSDKTE